MKSRSCGLVQRIGTADSATPHPDPSGGQAPRLAKSSTALHFLIPPSAVGLQFGTFRRWRAGIEVDWRAHPGSESGTCFRTNGAGTRRWILPRPTPTPAGDKPLASRSLRPRYIFSFRHRPSVYNSARFAGGEPASRLIGGHIPDRSPGHVPIAHPGWRRHTKYEKPELWFGTVNWHGGFCHAPPRPQRGTSPRATYVSVDEVRGFPSPRDRRGGRLCAAASFQTAGVSLCFDSRPYSFYAPGTHHWAQALFEPG